MPPHTEKPGETIHLEHARSAILDYLADRGKPVENLKLLTTAVRTAEIDRRGVSPADLRFHDVHDAVLDEYLPALDREGLVEYNRVTGTVSLGVSPDRVG